MAGSVKLAAVQACPVFLDRDATIEKACQFIARTGAAGANLTVFPEAFVSGYPVWVWFIPAGHTRPLRDLYARFVESAVTVPSTATERLCAAAKAASTAVAIGINELNAEASGTTVFNTLLYINADGQIIGKHRKVMPTGGERLMWGFGDGSDLEVYDLPFGRVGGLICWENYMPLARYALSAWGAEILLAPTWDRGEPWLSTMRHTAKEGRAFVVSCCTPMRKSDIADSFSFKHEYLGAVEDWLNSGDSVIVDPDGRMIAGPAHREEAILYAEFDRARVSGSRWQLDVAGHYARPDIFELVVHRKVKPLVTMSSPSSDDERDEAVRRKRGQDEP